MWGNLPKVDEWASGRPEIKGPQSQVAISSLPPLWADTGYVFITGFHPRLLRHRRSRKVLVPVFVALQNVSHHLATVLLLDVSVFLFWCFLCVKDLSPRYTCKPPNSRKCVSLLLLAFFLCNGMVLGLRMNSPEVVTVFVIAYFNLLQSRWPGSSIPVGFMWWSLAFTKRHLRLVAVEIWPDLTKFKFDIS